MLSEEKPLFDNSLNTFIAALLGHMDPEAVSSGVFLRDATGRLTYYSNSHAPSARQVQKIKKSLRTAMGSYVKEGREIIFRDELGAARILEDTTRLPLKVGDNFYYIIDRRIVGNGWLDTPRTENPNPPRIVFSSLKGGVGRSTALAFAAADFSRKNRNVLAIDLDLEAPGLGALLLAPDRMPKFGAVDILVENGIGGISSESLDSFIGTSDLTLSTGGRVDVLPAFGTSANRNPENVLPKLSRAMIEDIAPDGTISSVAKQIDDMIQKCTARHKYDAVLIDSRAGLAELTAPAVLSLGATILLFGTAQRQTIEGYKPLFAAMKLIAQRDRYFGRDALWRQMIRPVCAKAVVGGDLLRAFRDDLYDLFAENLYDEEIEFNDVDEVFFYDIDDKDAPHSPLIIPFHRRFVEFDSAVFPEQLKTPFYENTFNSFLQGLEDIVEGANNINGMTGE